MKPWCVIVKVKVKEKWATMVFGPLESRIKAIAVLRDFARKDNLPIKDDSINSEHLTAMALEMIDRYFTEATAPPTTR